MTLTLKVQPSNSMDLPKHKNTHTGKRNSMDLLKNIYKP
jgi:hypothetical protein